MNLLIFQVQVFCVLFFCFCFFRICLAGSRRPGPILLLVMEKVIHATGPSLNPGVASLLSLLGRENKANAEPITTLPAATQAAQRGLEREGRLKVSSPG